MPINYEKSLTKNQSDLQKVESVHANCVYIFSRCKVTSAYQAIKLLQKLVKKAFN